jgi:hypothetical protein
MVYFFGTALYVGILLTNAIAILSEERFLAKSTFPLIPFPSTLPLPLLFVSPILQSISRFTDTDTIPSHDSRLVNPLLLPIPTIPKRRLRRSTTRSVLVIFPVIRRRIRGGREAAVDSVDFGCEDFDA